ncbi:MAG: glutaredoxin 3 [Burkholderiales bacterium]|nr:glutaredoxin 3 [Burkholderiales bacterium]
MQKVVIYSKQVCPYCTLAKNLLKQKGVTQFEEIRIDTNEQLKQDMVAKTNRTTVPQIFIGTTHVGGFDDLTKLNQSGKLDQLLQ